MLKKIFNCVLGPPSPGGSQGRVRSATLRRKSGFLGRFRPGSGGILSFNLYFGLKRSGVADWVPDGCPGGYIFPMGGLPRRPSSGSAVHRLAPRGRRTCAFREDVCRKGLMVLQGLVSSPASSRPDKLSLFSVLDMSTLLCLVRSGRGSFCVDPELIRDGRGTSSAARGARFRARVGGFGRGSGGPRTQYQNLYIYIYI